MAATKTSSQTMNNNPNGITICFAAIFRNESKNVYRCLNGVKSIIDYVSICDTGSTDDTVELIERWGKENNIPVKMHYAEFENFGLNRTLSFKMAKKAFPQADYCLLVDADMILKIEKDFDKNSLNKDQYHVKQKSSIIEYWNTRVVRMKLPWVCLGVTHEYWDCGIPNPRGSKNFWKVKTEHNDEQLRGLWIDDREDGGHKADKFSRDKRLLTEGIADPTEPDFLKIRYMFYLGQTLRDFGDFAGSIHWYRKRIEAGGWPEELYYSQLQIGVVYEKMGSYERAAGSYLEAWQMRPSRAEPLQHLARMYRVQKKNHLAMMFALQGKTIPFPTSDRLFVDYRTYSYLFDEEISINAYYVPGMKEKGKESVLALLSMKDEIPESTRQFAIRNSKFYGVSA